MSQEKLMNVLVGPHVSEKSARISEGANQFVFRVRRDATKTDIKRAVQELWDVKVHKVRTQNRKGKPRRHKMAMGHTSDWKKAIVQLDEEDRIAFF